MVFPNLSNHQHFFSPLWVFFSLLSHICGIMLEDGRSKQEGVVNLSSHLFGRQVAERWPCKSYWHCGDIHLVYPYSHSRCPFMKTCAICHRVSPWLCSLINLSVWDGGDLLAQHLWPGTQGFSLCYCQKKKKKTVGMAIAVLLTASLRNLHYSELKGAPGSGKQQKKKSVSCRKICSKICLVIHKWILTHIVSCNNSLWTVAWFIISVIFDVLPHFSSSP